MDSNLKLTRVDCVMLQNPTAYRRFIGRLIYLTTTRLDIAYLVQILSQYMDCPHQPHLDAAFRVLRYLKSAPRQGIFILLIQILNLRLFVIVTGLDVLTPKGLLLVSPFFLEIP